MPNAGPVRGRPVLNKAVFDLIMNKNGWKSSKDAAQAMNLHLSTIARLRAHETTPSLDVALAIAEVTGLPIHALFSREEASA